MKESRVELIIFAGAIHSLMDDRFPKIIGEVSHPAGGGKVAVKNMAFLIVVPPDKINKEAIPEGEGAYMTFKPVMPGFALPGTDTVTFNQNQIATTIPVADALANAYRQFFSPIIMPNQKSPILTPGGVGVSG